MRSYKYAVAEHDPERPWIIRHREHQTVELEDDVPFFAWAALEHPAPRFSVQLDPWQLEPQR